MNYRLCAFRTPLLILSLLMLVAGSFASGNFTPITHAAGTITGNVFRDFNANGIDEGAAELGVAGVTVTAYDAAGAAQGTATTDANGDYTLNATGTGPYRLEFTTLPVGTFTGPSGTGSASTVQFVPDGASVANLGISFPDDYLAPTARLMTSMFINGDPLAGGTSGTEDALVRFPLSASGDPANTSIAPALSVGAMWGLAYQQQTDTLFASAFVRRHAGLGPYSTDGSNGPGPLDQTGGRNSGTGGIYRVQNANSASPTVGAFVDVQAIGINTGNFTQARMLVDDAEAANTDTLAFALVGKLGIGDLDVSPDGQYLYLTNLNDRTVYRIFIDSPAVTPTAADVTSYPNVPWLTSNPCINGVARPFGLKPYGALVYVGVTCTGESELTDTSANLTALVYALDPVAGTASLVLNVPLTYLRGQIFYHWGAAGWYPWTDTYSNAAFNYSPVDSFMRSTPLLSDLEFDRSGAMILGFTDRVGLLMGVNNYLPDGSNDLATVFAGGDILRACPNGSGWQLENAGICGGITGAGTNDNTFGADFAEGPGNNEFYNDNFLQISLGDMNHEASLGGLANIPGLNQIATTAMDPGQIESNGVSWLSNADGSLLQNYRVYYGESGRFYKSVGLGDLELLNAPAPLEIGNRVWRDSNNNGRQDPGEPMLAGVTVTLHNSAGTQIASTTTDGNGEYLFNSANLPGGIQPNTGYQIRINISQGVLTNLSPTLLDYNGNAATSDLNDSDGDPAINAGFATVSLTTGGAGQNDHTYDFGFATGFSLGDRVFVDVNNNGIVDGSDSWLVGVTVNLYRDSNNDGVPDGALIATQPTIANGYYLFTGLTADTYIVEIVPPAGYISSTGTNGSASGPFEPAADADSNPSDNDDNGSTSGAVIRSAPVTLTAGGEPTGEPATPGHTDPATDANSNLTVDFGLFFPLNLGNLVWNDLNNNGLVDGGESGIPSVPVELYTAAQTPGVDTPIATTKTDASGHYQFSNLTPGDYLVLIPTSAFAPGGTLEDQVSSTGTNGSATGPYQAAPDPNNNLDNDDNGSSTAAGVISLPVTLSPNSEPPIGVDGDDTYGNLTVDFGFFAPASLGDFVWYDTTPNGIQDSAETGVSGVTATLHNAADDSVVAVTTTDAAGAYLFDNLIPGSYYVIFSTLPVGYDFVMPDLGGDALDSDVTSITGRTGNYSLVAGQHQLTVDAGIASANTLRLGNLLWADYNDNGRVDSGEPGIAGVTVDLFDSLGNTLASTTTDANGHYLFSNLTPGDYSVVISFSQFSPGGPLENWVSSSAGGAYEPAPDPNTDSDNDDNGNSSGGVFSDLVTLSLLGEPDSAVDGDNTNGNLTVDFGFVPQPASLGDVVWYDSTRNNVQDSGELGVPGVTVRLYDANGLLVTTQTTDASGNYLFSNLVPGDYSVVFDISTLPSDYRFVAQDSGADDTLDSDANILTGRTATTTLTAGENDLTWDAGVYELASLGNYVWLDRNHDGIQDASELGVPNVTVNLLDSGGALVATTTTTANGGYRFPNLEPGTYQVEFVPPAGYALTIQDSTTDTSDSDANPVSGRTVTTTLALGQHDQTWDAGLIGTMSLGNLVWEDTNNNGRVNVGESGIAGVTVRLYQDSNNDGVPDGPALATTTTDAQGNYLFSNLVPGTYLVELIPPVGYRSSTGSNGSARGPFEAAPDPDTDTDNDDNGTTVGTVIRSGPITLVGNSEPITDGDTDANSNLTIDFGLFRPASLGDDVWHDQDADGVRDAGEPGVPGVTVTLYDQLGHVVATATTDANGHYLFDNLTPGSYSIGFSNLPPNLTLFTLPNSGSDDAADSDADPTTGRTSTVTLTPGAHNPTLDAGLVVLGQTTAITLAHFSATWQGHIVQLAWTTSSEIDTFGFHLLRSTDGTRASAIRVAPPIILARGRGHGGASYSWTDTDVELEQAYTYWLEETEVSGQTHEYGPVFAQARTATVTSPIFIPIIAR